MPLPYRKFHFYYPPRPNLALDSSSLKEYDTGNTDGDWMGEAKMNGSNCTIYKYGKEEHIYNRHGEPMSNFKADVAPVMPKKRGLPDWFAVNGEYMNKGKEDSFGNVFRNKFVIFDLLVYENKYLLGTTFKERFDVLKYTFKPQHSYDNYLWQLSDDVFMVKPILYNFARHFQILATIDMYEGLVLKKKDGKMESGMRKENTGDEQFKFRKETKNYAY